MRRVTKTGKLSVILAGCTAASASMLLAIGMPFASASSVPDANLLTVATYMQQHGFTASAAAGVAATVAGESDGNPESVGDGGNGLIGWTPAKPGIVTGDAAVDLQAQLPLVLSYYQANPDYNAYRTYTGSPVAAADIASQQFERPAVADSDVRPDVAEYVYAQLGG